MTGQQTQPKAKARPLMVACAMSAALFVLGTRHALGAGLPCSYEVSAIIQAPDGPFGLASPTTGSGISPNGRYVCGFYNPGAIGNSLAFVYDTKTSQFITLPNPPGITSVWNVGDVNDAGQVVGEHGGAAGNVGFIYDLNTGRYTQLPPLHPDGICSVNAINSSGVVCGHRTISGSPGYPYNAFIWSPKVGFTDLGVMSGPSSMARDITDQGQVCGWYGSSANSTAFVWTNGTMTSLGPVLNGTTSSANGINNAGMIAGGGKTTIDGATLIKPFSNSDGVWNLLPTLDSVYKLGGTVAINDSGIIVGACTNANNTNDRRACVWSGETVADLNQLVVTSLSLFFPVASAISPSGVVVGWASQGGDVVAVVLIPSPAVLGDTNCNEVVDVDDLLSVINSWGPCEACQTDFTNDQFVDVADLIVVIENWTVKGK